MKLGGNGDNMIRDLDAASSAGNTVAQTCPHRKLATKHQDICLPVIDPVLRHRVIPFETLQCTRIATRLAAAQALIGDLELALCAAGENAIHDPLAGVSISEE
jgi:hypothetical protein